MLIKYSLALFFTASLGALSMSLGLFLSPIIVGICKRKSTRLTAVIGGLVLSLGCLFSSFANQFHQLYFSHAVMTGKKWLSRTACCARLAIYLAVKKWQISLPMSTYYIDRAITTTSSSTVHLARNFKMPSA